MPRHSRCLAAVAALIAIHAFAATSPQIPLPGAAIPQFVEPLPQLSVAGGTLTTLFGNQPLTLTMCEFKSNVLPLGTLVAGQRPETWVWGYIPGTTCPTTTQDTYLGPVIVNARGTPTPITFVNNLGHASTTNVLAYKYGTDQTLHWADPLNGEANMCAMHSHMPPAFGSMCAQNYAGPIAAVPHLHGGEVPPELDGGPDAWFTSDGQFFGHAYYSKAARANSALYAYPNTQEAAPIWFHDHTLGATRLNVYAGLAGGYLIVDPALSLPANLPGPAQIVPLIIQDRQFDTSGQLFFPAGAAVAPNAEHPYWSPEFLGDAIVVNGKAWPFMNVEPRRYRFLVLNGSNARAYELFLTNPITKIDGPAIWVIGTDGGYLDAPVKLDPLLKQKLVIMPGERYEILIDFGGQPAGTTLNVRNTAKAPFPNGATVAGSTLGRVLQFRVTCPAAGCPVDASYDPASGIPLRSGGQQLVRLASAAGAVAPGVTVAKTRQLTLNEVMMMPATVIDPVTGVLTAYPGGPFEVLVNNTKWSGESPRPYGDFTAVTVNGVTTYYSEIPKEGDTEVWELVNLTADAHPIHLHLVQFQVLSRQAFNFKAYNAAYDLAFPAVPGDPTCIGGVYCPGFGPPLDYNTGLARAVGGNPDVVPFLKGPVKPPLPQEQGWKDTVIAYPGEVTRLVVRWAPTDLPVNAASNALHFPFDPSGQGQHGYVWHCHIIDHEDNEMMRPDVVALNPDAPAPLLRALVKGVDY